MTLVCAVFFSVQISQIEMKGSFIRRRQIFEPVQDIFPSKS